MSNSINTRLNISKIALSDKIACIRILVAIRYNFFPNLTVNVPNIFDIDYIDYIRGVSRGSKSTKDFRCKFLKNDFGD